MYDFIEQIEKRFDNMYSYGGKTERSFFQNVGKIVNKTLFDRDVGETFDKILDNVKRIEDGEPTNR